MPDLTWEVWSVNEEALRSTGARRDKATDLVRHGVLAPSSHNLEPWQFQLHDDGVDVFSDFSRWLCSP